MHPRPLSQLLRFLGLGLLLLLGSNAAFADSVADTTCNSVECVSLSAQIASRMNASADPCRDFYQFACGNFHNEVRYNPAKAQQAGFQGDYLFEDTIGLMSDKLESNIYELLVLDRVAVSRDPGIATLYNFTRTFYRTCRTWLQQQEWASGPSGNKLSASFLKGVLDHLNRTLLRSANGIDGAASIETFLAALVRSGGRGLLSISLPGGFAFQVLERNDGNLTWTVRASVDLALGHLRQLGPAQDVAKAQLQTVTGLLEKLLPRRVAEELRFKTRSAKFAQIRSGLLSFIDGSSELINASNSAINCSDIAQKLRFTVAELDQLSACTADVFADSGYNDSNVSSGEAFSWSAFFQELLESPVDPRAMLVVRDPLAVARFAHYFRSLNSVGGVGRFSDAAAFLLLDWLLSFAAFLPRQSFAQVGWLSAKPQAITLPQSETSVGVCMMWSKTLLQPVLERMYQMSYHRGDFSDIGRLVQLIKEASIAGVNRQAWITPGAKLAIAAKIRSTKQTIGLDDITTGELKSFYSATIVEFNRLKVDPDRFEDSFGALMSLALCAYSRKNFDLMSGDSPVSMFMLINPLVVNAFNWQEKNEIIFPMAILDPPVYHPAYPDYINIGSLGYIIGHEIGHSFDNAGHAINKQGALGHFWDNRTERGFLDRMECVRTRYGTYSLFPGGPAHDSNSTLGNDIADIIGASAAVQALKLLRHRRHRRMPRMPNLGRHYTPEQMLFIQAAQCWCMKTEPHVLSTMFTNSPSHSPHHIRVRGIAENSVEFAAAFRCPRSAPMNPVGKCTFW